MIKQLLMLTEQRLHRLGREQSALRSRVTVLCQQQQDIQVRVQAMQAQNALYDQAAELTRDAFFERQRHKAALQADIARLLYQLERLRQEQTILVERQRQQQCHLRETHQRCEKFRSYLKRLVTKRCLQSDLQRQYEIEELSTYGGHKNSTALHRF
jgi:chromosome segregation ATPase